MSSSYCLCRTFLQPEVPELAIDDFSDYEDDEHARRSSWTVWVPALKAVKIKPKMSWLLSENYGKNVGVVANDLFFWIFFQVGCSQQEVDFILFMIEGS